MGSAEVLDQLIQQAEVRLDAAAGSTSLCTVSRSGAAMPGVKYPEGSWVALRDVRRMMKTVTDMSAAISLVRQQWEADLQRHTSSGSGSNWIAYLTGGLDALDELSDAMSTGTA
jgi:hypothetical protein